MATTSHELATHDELLAAELAADPDSLLNGSASAHVYAGASVLVVAR